MEQRPPDIFAPDRRQTSVSKYTLTVVGIAVGVMIGFGILGYAVAEFFAFIIEALSENASEETVLTHASLLAVIAVWAIILPIIYIILSRQARPVRLLFRKPAGAEIVMALKYYGIFTLPASLILLLVVLLGQVVDLSDFQYAQTSAPLSEIVIFFFAAVIVAPLAEEIFFRGYFYPSLRRRHNFWPAFWMSGSLFALVHIGTHNLYGLISVFALGYFMTLAMEKTRNLWVPIMIHALNNFVVFMFTYVVSIV